MWSINLLSLGLTFNYKKPHLLLSSLPDLRNVLGSVLARSVLVVVYQWYKHVYSILFLSRSLTFGMHDCLPAKCWQQKTKAVIRQSCYIAINTPHFPTWATAFQKILVAKSPMSSNLIDFRCLLNNWPKHFPWILNVASHKLYNFVIHWMATDKAGRPVYLFAVTVHILMLKSGPACWQFKLAQE